MLCWDAVRMIRVVWATFAAVYGVQGSGDFMVIQGYVRKSLRVGTIHVSSSETKGFLLENYPTDDLLIILWRCLREATRVVCGRLTVGVNGVHRWRGMVHGHAPSMTLFCGIETSGSLCFPL